MNLNLKQVVNLEYILRHCSENNVKPVLIYKGHVITGDLFEIDDNSKNPFTYSISESGEKFKNKIIHQISVDNFKIDTLKGFLKANKLEYAFSYLCKGLDEWKHSDEILDISNIKYIYNVQFLDNSLDESIKFIHLDDNPKFEWISLLKSMDTTNNNRK